MKNLKGILLGVLLFGGIIGGVIYWKANEKVTDLSDVRAEAIYAANELLELEEAAVNAMTGKNIVVSGFVFSNEGSETERTVTLGRNDLNLIICQIDNRHLATMSKLNKGQYIGIKGTISGHDFDELMGKTIQMKNCVLGKLQ